jgi:hypothetical protein
LTYFAAIAFAWYVHVVKSREEARERIEWLAKCLFLDKFWLEHSLRILLGLGHGKKMGVSISDVAFPTVFLSK